MKTVELISQAWAKAEGEAYTDGVGSDTWNYMFILANYFIGTCTTEAGVSWVSLYDPLFNIGNVTATDTFDLDADEVRKLSDQTEDYVRIVHTDLTNYTDYKIVKANQLKQYFNSKACAKIGDSLKFSRPFTSADNQFGGTIYVPKYGSFDLLTNDSSTVPTGIESWLVCMIAYDVALHDILRKDTANNILAEANDHMKSMKADNNAAQEQRANMANLSFLGGSNDSGGSTSNPLDM